MSDVHQLSRAAYERLQAEYEDLTTRGRIEIAQAIERARELGDLSENGDYQAAKDQQIEWLKETNREQAATIRRLTQTNERAIAVVEDVAPSVPRRRAAPRPSAGAGALGPERGGTR